MRQPDDDIATIRRLMEDSQRAVTDSGSHFMLWGVISAIGLAVTWAAAVGALSVNVSWVWLALLATGWAASIWIGRRESERARVRGAGQRLLAVLWIGCGVTLTLIAVAGMFGGAVSLSALPGLVAAVVGLGFLGTSAVAGMSGARYLAAAWWAGGAVMLFIPGVHTLLVLAGMAVALQVLPGVALYVRSKRTAQPPA